MYLMLLLRSKAEMKMWVEARENRDKPFFNFFTNGSGPAWACFVLKNMSPVWDHKWLYHEKNVEVCDAEKAQYLKFKDMTEEEAEDLGSDDKAKWEKYRNRSSLFTSSDKRVRFGECVSKRGLGFYYKSLEKFTKFLALDKDDPRMKDFISQWWACEETYRLTDIRTRRKRGFGSISSSVAHKDDEEHDGGIRSKRMAVVLPGDEGYMNHLSEMASAFSYSSDGE